MARGGLVLAMRDVLVQVKGRVSSEVCSVSLSKCWVGSGLERVGWSMSGAKLSCSIDS